MRRFRFFRRGRADIELQEEIDSYLAEETADNIERGMTTTQARRYARMKLGNPRSIRETLWQQNTVSLLDKLGRDLKYAFRTLSRTPGFSLIAIAVMALCIGATTSLFTVVRSVLLRSLPFRDPGHLVMLYDHFRDPSMNAQGFNYNTVAAADFYDWQTQTHGFEGIAAWRWAQFNLTGEHEELPELVSARGATWNLFSLLGVPAAIGRTFIESEDRTDGNAVMLTWSLFRRRFGGDPSIVGRQIHLDGKSYTVVGVLPKWFNYPSANVQVWVTFASGMAPSVLQRHDFHFSHVVARLRPDVSLANALGQVGATQYRLHMQNLNAPVAEDVASRTINDDLARDVKKPLLLLMCAVACLLLIGCLNVANMLVARCAARQKEMAIRGALGAQRATLIRAQFTESLLICGAGGVGGVLLSLASTKWLAHAWSDLPSAEIIRVDGVVLGFVCLVVFAAALVAGLLPAISTTGKAVFGALQSSSRTAAGSLSNTTVRKTLLAVEIAVTVILLISAGLLLKTFFHLRATNLGCATENVLTMSYSLPMQRYDTSAKVNTFNETLLQRVRALPGVHAVALGSTVPGTGPGGDDTFTILEHPPLPPSTAMPDAMTRWIDPQYFSALQIPLLSGRFFTGDDRAGRPKTVIVNRQLVEQYFLDENPLGKHLHLAARESGDYQVVGVVADTLYKVGQPAKPTMYFPVLNGLNTDLGIAVRMTSDPLAMSIPIQKQIAALDPELPVDDVLTMDQIIEQSLDNESLSATIVLVFAVLSLILASVGLYGVLSYLMTQRTMELGIRMALGAERKHVLWLMLFDGLRPAIIGLVLGSGASASITRLFRSMLYDTRPLDPTVHIAVTFTLLMVATLACIIPAWRASRLDPMQALRAE
jgi:putative ABC transport system permease protein